jgi:uncharacterized protein (DUF2384 family)
MDPVFRIDEEFKRLHRNLTEEERSQLWADLNAHGILSPLIVWREKRILLDGHNRDAWAQSKKVASGPVKLLSFPDRTAAMQWAIGLQLGRRNLTPDEASLLRGKAYNLQKKPEGRPGKRNQSDLVNGQTAKRLAKDYGVGEATIKRDGKFAAAVETIAEHVPEIEVLVNNGRCPIPRGTLVEAAERISCDPQFAIELREQLQPAAASKEHKTKPRVEKETDEEADRQARFNRVRYLASDLFRCSIGLDELGSKARREYWLSSPTVTDITRKALVNLQSDVNSWLGEINELARTETA